MYPTVPPACFCPAPAFYWQTHGRYSSPHAPHPAGLSASEFCPEENAPSGPDIDSAKHPLKDRWIDGELFLPPRDGSFQNMSARDTDRRRDLAVRGGSPS